MILWTIQSIDQLNKLVQTGTLQTDYMDETFSEVAYRYMREQLCKRVGPPPSAASWPVWAWAQYDGISKSMPDITQPGHVEPGHAGALIEFEIAENECLFSDFFLYHEIMNLSPIFDTDEEQNLFDQELNDAGLWFGDSSKVLAHPQFGPRVVSTWQKIFDLDTPSERLPCVRSERSIQAVFWSLPIERVRNVVQFIGAENDF